MGMMLLVLIPLPYVDASSARTFREKCRRMLVSAAGIMVDLFVASIAMFVWLIVSPGSPLDRLRRRCDRRRLDRPLQREPSSSLRRLLLSPTGSRSRTSKRGIEYVGYLCERHVFGGRPIQPPDAGPGEPFWFVAYTMTSFVYRAFLFAGIILFIAGKFFIAGSSGGVGGDQHDRLPRVKRIRFVATSPVLRNNRGRAVFATVAILAARCSSCSSCRSRPGPARKGSSGSRRRRRAGRDDCFIGKVVVPPNSPVEKGMLLVECIDPVHYAEVRVLEAKLAELERRTMRPGLEPGRGRDARGRHPSARVERGRAKARRKELTIRSPGEGTFVVPGPQDLPGRFLKRGTSSPT